MSEEKKPLLIVDGTDRAQEDFQEEPDRVADSMKRLNANAQKVAQYDSGKERVVMCCATTCDSAHLTLAIMRFFMYFLCVFFSHEPQSLTMHY